MRVELPCRPLRPVLSLLMIVLIATGSAVKRALAETRSATTPNSTTTLTQPTSTPRTTTLVVFAEHALPDREWAVIIERLQKSAKAAAEETPALRGALEVLRGDTLPRGIRVDFPISVYLHGDCVLVPRPHYIVQGALGWVLRVHGEIEPFIHVQCTQLRDMLGPFSTNMSSERRDTVMGEAITRVVLHEWIHIATQNPSHTKNGVEKSQFGPSDLLADDDQLQRFRAMHDKKKKRG